MFRELSAPLSADRTFKIERARHFTTHRVPAYPVSLEALKLTEEQLRRRALIAHSSSEDFYPLWFLAETERNVFLWQHHFSLSDMSLFHFSIDIDALIEKRMRHISSGNSFNSLDDGFDQASSTQGWRNNRERDYLRSLQQTLQPLMPHLSALSSTISDLENSNPASAEAINLVLPYRPDAGKA